MKSIQKDQLQKDLDDQTMDFDLKSTSEIKWQATFDRIKDSIFLLDINGIILEANKISFSLFGKESVEILGHHCYEIIHKSNCFFDECPFARMKISKQRETMLLPEVDKWFDVIVDPIFNKKNELVGAIHFVVDITELKRSEQIIEQQCKQLQELNSSKDKLFSIISHDLRSPFQDLISLTGLLSEGIGDISSDELSDLSKKMHNNAKCLSKLLDELFDWARMQQGVFTFEPEVIDLSFIVTQNINLLIQRSEEKGIVLNHTITKNQKVYADEEMLNAILRNLLYNAIKFTNKGGRVTVNAEETENNLVNIIVHDTGIGMPVELSTRLFKMGEKVGRRGTKGEDSTGLGLILCKEFVKKHGGEIWVESKENVGSTFSFTLRKV
jgi:PAS domain S-box-containing protein